MGQFIFINFVYIFWDVKVLKFSTMIFKRGMSFMLLYLFFKSYCNNNKCSKTFKKTYDNLYSYVEQHKISIRWPQQLTAIIVLPHRTLQSPGVVDLLALSKLTSAKKIHPQMCYCPKTMIFQFNVYVNIFNKTSFQKYLFLEVEGLKTKYYSNVTDLFKT